MRRHLVIVAVLAVLAVVNVGIYERERLISSGQVVFLELAPVDPRSLMQGDYMALRFQAANEAQASLAGSAGTDGHLVVALDERGIGRFRRLDDSTPIATDEIRLRYRVRGGEMKFATNAYFFQEGEARTYASARFGEFRVDNHGEMILTGLRGEDLRALSPG